MEPIKPIRAPTISFAPTTFLSMVKDPIPSGHVTPLRGTMRSTTVYSKLLSFPFLFLLLLLFLLLRSNQKLQSLLKSLPTIYHSPTKGTVFASAAIIRSVVGSDTFTPVVYDGVPLDQLDSCKIRWESGQITDRHGIPLTTTGNFTNKSNYCNRGNYNKISDLVSQALDDETKLFGDELINHNYYLDQLGFTSELQTCLNYGLEFLNEKTEKKNLVSSMCSIQQQLKKGSEKDPCCNPQLQWESACVSRNITLGIGEYTRDWSVVEKFCSAEDCTGTYVVDYGTAVGTMKDPLNGCVTIDEGTDLTSSEYTWIPYNECRKKYLGENATLGISCWRDEDCWSGRCDLLNHRCLIDRRKQEENFLICLSKKLSPLVLYTIQDSLGMKEKVSTEEFGRELLDLLSTDDCATDYDFPLDYRNSAKFHTLTTCLDTCADFRCWDPKCTVPTVCRQYTFRTCFKSIVSPSFICTCQLFPTILLTLRLFLSRTL